MAPIGQAGFWGRALRIAGWLAVLPFVLVGWLLYLDHVRGPNWIMVPQDLSYNYLFNAVNVLNGDAIGSLIHPAITTIYFYAALIFGTHAFYGTGDIARAVVANPEKYFEVIAHAHTALLGLSSFAMGLLCWRGLKSVRLAMLVQTTPFFFPPVVMILNGYGGPESLVLCLAMIQIGLVVRALDGRLSTDTGRWIFAIQSAIICAAIVATKLHAIPILAIPAMMLPTFRRRFQMGAIFGILSLGLLSPIFLIPENLAQAKVDAVELIRTMRAEAAEREAVAARAAQESANGKGWRSPAYPPDSLISAYYKFPAAIPLLAIGAISFVVLLVGSNRLRLKDDPTIPYALRAYFVLQVGTFLGFAFVILRPKVHYLTPFAEAQIAALAVALYLLARARRETAGASPTCLRNEWFATGFVSASLAAAAMFGSIFYPAAGLSYVDGVRRRALMYMDLTLNAGGDSATITRIQASNPPTAYEHAVQTSRFMLAPEVAAVTPSTHFSFAGDGVHVWNGQRYNLRIDELVERFDAVFFWTTVGNYWNGQDRMQGLLREEGWMNAIQSEIAGRITALGMLPPYDERETSEALSTRGWHVEPCDTGWLCLVARINNPLHQPLSHVRLFADAPDQVSRMPELFEVYGSQDGVKWTLLGRHRDRRPWALEPTWRPERANRVFDIDNDAFHPFIKLRMRAAGVAAATWPGRIQLLSRGGCADGLIAIPTRMEMLRAENLRAKGAERALVEGRFFERVSASALASEPVTLAAELDSVVRISGYSLSTGSEGERTDEAVGRMPRGWRLEVSLDGRDWRRLDERTGEPAWLPDESRSYRLAGPTDARMLRLVVNEGADPRIVRIYGFGVDVVRPPAEERRYRRSKLPVDGFYEIAGSLPIAIELELPSSVPVMSYRLTSDVHGSDGRDRMPVSWDLFGSEDGSRWTLLDRRQAEAAWQNGESRTYLIEGAHAFRQYRILVRDAGSAGIVRIGNVALFAPREAFGKKADERCRVTP